MKAIERKIQILKERIERLERVADQVNSFADYQRSPNLKDITERNVQVAIEACLDIGKIIISEKGLREPKDNKSVFVVLSESGIISEKCLSFLVPMAGTRNILVHSYDRIDDSVMYGILKRHLPDFKKFLSEIKNNYFNRLNQTLI